jgi:GNAT superfamily N-acetyltransferase
MSLPIRVEPATQLEPFIRFPFRRYAQEPHWVPPLLIERRDFLDPRKNPVFEYAKIQPFLAWRGDEVVGTLAAVRNDRYGQFHPDESAVGFFGLFETVSDQAVVDALVSAGAAWLRAEGKTVMRGPVNFTTNDVVGLLVEGFDDDPTLMMPYNPPDYGPMLEAAGFTKAKDLYAFYMGVKDYQGQFDAVAKRLQQHGRFKIRPVDLSKWGQELEFVRSTYNVAWAQNWGFVPWTDAELAFIAKELKPLIDPHLAFVVEVDNTPAGFLIAVPDAHEALKLAKGRLLPFGLLRILWKLKVQGCRRIRTMAMGVLPAFRGKGLDAFLVHHLSNQARELGYEGSELGWILEDNAPMLGHLAHLGARRTKTYRVYDRAI